MQESLELKVSGVVVTTLDVKRAWNCSILYEDEEVVEVKSCGVEIAPRAFEVTTARLHL